MTKKKKTELYNIILSKHVFGAKFFVYILWNDFNAWHIQSVFLEVAIFTL